MFVRTLDEVGEKLLPDGTDDTVPDVTGIFTEGLSLSDAGEVLVELVPLIDRDPPLG